MSDQNRNQSELQNESAASKSEWRVHLNKRWKARVFVSLAMLVLAFIGLIIMNIHATSYWIYSCIMAVLFALLSLWLFWYLNRGEHKVSTSTIWHQLLHWVGLMFAIYIVSLFVGTGIMGTMQAGLVTLLLLALTIFIVGIYTDLSFVLIGITLAIFAAAAAMIEAYLSVFMIPILIAAAIIIVFIIQHQHRKAKQS